MPRKGPFPDVVWLKPPSATESMKCRPNNCTALKTTGVVFGLKLCSTTTAINVPPCDSQYGTNCGDQFQPRCAFAKTPVTALVIGNANVTPKLWGSGCVTIGSIEYDGPAPLKAGDPVGAS